MDRPHALQMLGLINIAAELSTMMEMSGGSAMTVKSSAGGAANEGGSLHRSGTAAIFAVHGLTGSPVLGLAGCVPTGIALETGDDVDDIRVEMRNGARWFIQAKTSANKDALLSALRQFSAQPTRPGDRLILLLRSQTAMMRGAGVALDRRRSSPSARLTNDQTKHLKTFRDLLKTCAGARTAGLLKQIHILQWQAQDAHENHANAASARIEGVIVESTDGPASFRALQSYMQTAAAERAETHIADWVAALRNAAISLLKESGNSPGAREAARSLALSTYQQTWAATLDQIDLHAICTEVPFLTVPDFLRDVEVHGPRIDEREDGTRELRNVIRRNRRIVVEGLPGAGKSEAMRQLVAWLASDGAAPLPLLVRVSELAARVTSVADITMGALISVALAAPGNDDPHLREAVTRQVAGGHCIFLIDGLDEAYSKQGLVAAGLNGVFEQAHPDVGVVLTSRASARHALKHCGWPTVTMAPQRDHRAQKALLEQLGDGKTAKWNSDAARLMAEQRDDHGDVWSVPLLSTIATIRIARGKTPSTSAASLLRGVVEDSVSNWEERRHKADVKKPPTGFDTHMLLDAFAGLGRLLNTATGVTPVQAHAAVVEALARWEQAPPIRKLAASYAVSFWDETVGVFVENEDFVEARSRQFAELGDALYAVNLDNENALEEWVHGALSNPGQANAVAMATTDSVKAARWLIRWSATEPIRELRAQAMSWTAQAAPGWKHLTCEDERGIIDALADAVRIGLPWLSRDGSAVVVGEPGASAESAVAESWKFAVCLAAIPHRVDEVDRALASFHFGPAAMRVLEAIATFARLREGKGKPDSGAIRLAHEMLNTLPEDRDTESVSRDMFGAIVIEAGPSLPSGYEVLGPLLAAQAADLGDDGVQALWRFAGLSNVGTYQLMRSHLRAAGFNDPKPNRLPGVDKPTLEVLADLLDARWLLEPLSDQFPDDVPRTDDDDWRYSSLAKVFRLMRFDKASIADLRSAAELDVSLMTILVRALVKNYGLDGHKAAAQARIVLAEGIPKATSLLLHTPAYLEPEPEPAELDATEKPNLVRVVAEASAWISATAAAILLQHADPTVAALAREHDGKGWRNRWQLGRLRLSMTEHPEQEVERMMRLPSAYRAVVADYIRAADPAWGGEVQSALLADVDGTVRARAGGSLAQVEDAGVWSCVRCGAENKCGVYVCERCSAPSSQSVPVHTELRAGKSATPSVPRR